MYVRLSAYNLEHERKETPISRESFALIRFGLIVGFREVDCFIFAIFFFSFFYYYVYLYYGIELECKETRISQQHFAIFFL